MKDRAPRYVPLLKASDIDFMRGSLPRTMLNSHVNLCHSVLEDNMFNGYDDGYAVDGVRTNSYKDYFKFLEETAFQSMDLKDIEDYLERLKNKRRGKVHAVDFMGRGLFINNHPEWKQHVTTMTGVSLEGPGRCDPWNHHNEDDSFIVKADLYTSDGWMNLAKHMRRINVSGFQIGWCRPFGPFNPSVGHSWDVLNSNDLSYSILDITDFFSYMLGCMDVRNCILFAQLPQKFGVHNHKVAEYIRRAGYNVVTENFDSKLPLDAKMAVWKGLE